MSGRATRSPESPEPSAGSEDRFGSLGRACVSVLPGGRGSSGRAAESGDDPHAHVLVQDSGEGAVARAPRAAGPQYCLAPRFLSSGTVRGPFSDSPYARAMLLESYRWQKDFGGVYKNLYNCYAEF